MDLQQLLYDLYNAINSESVYNVVEEYCLNNSENWHPYGGNQNNAGTFENQQSSPENALVEKIANSIDAILMKQCLIRGFNPREKEMSDVPQDIFQAVENFWGVKDGRWENVTASERNEVAQNLQIVLSSDKKTPNVAVFDNGEGQIEKDEKRIKELDHLFRKIYEDNVNGKLNDERFYKLSDGYEAEQEQLKQEIEALTAEVSEADTEATNVAKLIAVTKKYTRIDELTPEVLNAFVDKIVVHEREKKDGRRTQQIDIYYSYVGIVDIPTDEEMREMEQEYMHRTKRQTA